MDEKIPVSDLVTDPVDDLATFDEIAHPQISLPLDMFGDARRNSKGIDLTDSLDTVPLLEDIQRWQTHTWSVAALIGGRACTGGEQPVTNPVDRRDVLGSVIEATAEDASKAVGIAVTAQKDWDRAGGAHRATVLEKAADMLEDRLHEFMALLVREAGKSLSDAIAEVREAIDFCRFYGAQARAEFNGPRALVGPTGEDNLYSLHGRGAFVCISPWNFPLAIFLGQVTAALAAGNSVLAKPAEQTPVVAHEAVRLLHNAGVPADVLHFLPGSGSTVGAALTADERIGGVAMTGSTATAKLINRTLADRAGPIIPFIAETGGQNAMFVDSTALPEQVVDDVIRSAFHSAGQRCSALRILYVQDDIADTVITMIKGAMDELAFGNVAELSVDVGPVIDTRARDTLQRHIDKMTADGRLLHTIALDAACDHGSFLAPHMFEITGAGESGSGTFRPHPACCAVQVTGTGQTSGGTESHRIRSDDWCTQPD